MKKLLRRLLLFVAGLTIKSIIDTSFNVVVYPLVMYCLGNVWGGIVATIISIPLNLMIIKAYDWSKTDWLAIEQVKSRIERMKQFWFLDEEDGWVRK